MFKVLLACLAAFVFGLAIVMGIVAIRVEISDSSFQVNDCFTFDSDSEEWERVGIMQIVKSGNKKFLTRNWLSDLDGSHGHWGDLTWGYYKISLERSGTKIPCPVEGN